MFPKKYNKFWLVKLRTIKTYFTYLEKYLFINTKNKKEFKIHSIFFLIVIKTAAVRTPISKIHRPLIFFYILGLSKLSVYDI